MLAVKRTSQSGHNLVTKVCSTIPGLYMVWFMNLQVLIFHICKERKCKGKYNIYIYIYIYIYYFFYIQGIKNILSIKTELFFL
jgi:hypothetical protein